MSRLNPTQFRTTMKIVLATCRLGIMWFVPKSMTRRPWLKTPVYAVSAKLSFRVPVKSRTIFNPRESVSHFTFFLIQLWARFSVFPLCWRILSRNSFSAFKTASFFVTQLLTGRRFQSTWKVGFTLARLNKRCAVVEKVLGYYTNLFVRAGRVAGHLGYLGYQVSRAT